MIEHIQYIGQFTGLTLNLDKTIAFSPKFHGIHYVHGIQISNTLVKYLGAFLGTGDLSTLNFEKPLRVARQKIRVWSSHTLTLKARVTVEKTFIYSLFIHVLNVVYIRNDQLELLQKLLNDFLWHGKNKIKNKLNTSPNKNGGMNMIHVKNSVHCLWVKWMFHLCEDVGVSWSRYAWEHVEGLIPFVSMSGVRAIREDLLTEIPFFYASILHSYAFVNNLFYEANGQASLPYNIWFSSVFPFCDKNWCLAGVNTICDLPLTNGKIDFPAIWDKVGKSPNVWLRCCTLQGMLMKYFLVAVPGQHMPSPLLKLQIKALLSLHSSGLLTLSRWEETLELMPLTEDKLLKVFQRMLVQYKVSKLWEINFKILSRILAIPIVIAAICGRQDLVHCAWCGERGSIDHILLWCPETLSACQ